MATSEAKKWGKGEYWGLSSDYDHDWVLTDEQKTLRNKLIEVCRTKIRPHAVTCDKTYTYPRKSLDVMADLGLLGIIVPKSLGGLGENHVGVTMVIETLARYGCPATAMVYTMHVGAVASLLFRHHNNPKIQKLLSRLDKYRLIGTQAYSDPATGGHNWFALSSKVKTLDENTLQMLKYVSFTTSAGYADWYAVECLSPDIEGNYSNMSIFLAYKDEIRASYDWSALGMHANQSGSFIVEGKFSKDRLVGPIGDGQKSMDEIVFPYFLLMTSACWNGISLACMDVAKRHVTRKAHADVGMRVCDYPTIQDYFGDCMASTSVCRSHLFLISEALDRETNNNDWSLHVDFEFMPRYKLLQWLNISKFSCAKNVEEVAGTMLRACGGTAYKTELGLERLFRDAKAAWVMGPSNEVVRQIIGKTSLFGMSSVDFWDQKCNERSLHHELGKLNLDEKKKLAQNLLEEVELEESGKNKNSQFQETDFENPFNTKPPFYFNKIFETSDGISHGPSLNPSTPVQLPLISRKDFGSTASVLTFGLTNSTDHSGCVAGQYVQIRVNSNGRTHERYFSPVSRPDDFGKLELILKFETQGIISNFLKELKPGDLVDVIGPCGGFEYEANKVDELTFLASGGGVTPALQLIRCNVNNPMDKTRINLIYYSETVDDILLREELETYAATKPRLRILFTLGEVPEDWEGEEGVISTEIIDKYVTKPNGNKHKIVMCGGSTMVVSCLYSLRSLSYPSDMIFIYGQLGAQQMKRIYGQHVKLSGHRCDNAA